MSVRTLPNGQPVDFGNHKNSSKPQKKKNGQRKKSGGQHPKMNKDSVEAPAAQTAKQSTKQPAKQQVKQQVKQPVKQPVKQNGKQHKDNQKKTYAGSSFNSSQPKVSELPKPTFNSGGGPMLAPAPAPAPGPGPGPAPNTTQSMPLPQQIPPQQFYVPHPTMMGRGSLGPQMQPGLPLNMPPNMPPPGIPHGQYVAMPGGVPPGYQPQQYMAYPPPYGYYPPAPVSAVAPENIKIASDLKKQLNI